METNNNINLNNISMNNVTLPLLLNCGFSYKENQNNLDELFLNSLDILTNEINNKFANSGEKILVNKIETITNDFTTQRIINIFSTSYFEIDPDSIFKGSLFDKCIILYENMWCKYVFLHYMITNFSELLKLDLSKMYPTYNQENINLLEHFSKILKRFLDTEDVKEKLINLVEKSKNRIKHYCYNNIDYKGFNQNFSKLLEHYIKGIQFKGYEICTTFKEYEILKDYILENCYNNYIFICKYYRINFNIQQYLSYTFNNADNTIFSVFSQETEL